VREIDRSLTLAHRLRGGRQGSKHLDKPDEKRETMPNKGDTPNTHSPSAQGVGGR